MRMQDLNSRRKRMSVLEVARLSVKDGAGDEFEAAFTQAHALVVAAKGRLASTLSKVVGSDDEYLFVVEWRALADHVDTFAGSPEFAAFEGLIGPHLAAAPAVAHYDTIEE
jgi:heme-degrading monooxygenase HmoA